MKAVITFARGWNALAATRSLGRKGIEVITGDEHRFAPASFSKYSVAGFLYPNPDREPEAFLDKMEEVIREHRPESGEIVLMPFHKETYLLSKHRARFEPICKFALPAIEQIEQVHDKGTLARTCGERRIPVPKTLVPESEAEFREAAKSFPYPAFVKLRKSASSVGVKKVNNAEEAVTVLDEFVAKHKPDDLPLLQQGVPGDDYCATFLFDHGEPRAVMTYHNLRSYPVRSGTGVLRETVQAPAIERIGRDFLAKLNWHGVAEIDFRWDGASDPWLIEVNPRFWGGLTQAVEAGWDYPYLLYRLAVDGKVDTLPAGDMSVRTETPVLAFLATLHEIANDDERMKKMQGLFDELRSGWVKGGRRKTLKQFFHGIPDAVDFKGRWERIRSLFHDHKHAKSDIFNRRDPLPALGILYPLAVFLKHGKVTTELLVDEAVDNRKNRE